METSTPTTPLRLAAITLLESHGWLADLWLELVAGLRAKGHTVHTIASKQLPGQHQQWQGDTFRWNLLARAKLKRLLTQAAPQAILTLGEKPTWFCGRVHPAPRVAILAGYRSNYATYATCAHVLALTPGLANASGLPATQLSQSYPFAAPIQTPPGTLERVRQAIGADLDVKVALVAGKLTVDRQLESLITASSAFSDLELWIEGDGPHRSLLEAHAQGMGLHIYAGRDRNGRRGGVRFIGKRPNLSEIMAAADVLYIPRPTEDFSSLLTRAMLSEIPVISTRFPQAESAVPARFCVQGGDAEEIRQALEWVLDADTPVAASFADAFAHAKSEWSRAAMVNRVEKQLQMAADAPQNRHAGTR